MSSFQLASDLHLEFYTEQFENKEFHFESFINPKAKNLILAGDISCINKYSQEIYNNFIAQCSLLFEHIFIVAGNHEFYQKTNQVWTMNKVIDNITRITRQYSNVHFLNNNVYEFSTNKYNNIQNDNKVMEIITNENLPLIILGTTLWSHVPSYLKPQIGFMINDYRKIHTDIYTLLTVDNTNTFFVENVQWLEQMLQKYKNNKIILITHHLPSLQLIAKQYQGNPINYAFASNLDKLFETNPNIIVCCSGHTHTSFDITINKTRCLVNPRGYKKEKNNNGNDEETIENLDYNKELIFDV